MSKNKINEKLTNKKILYISLIFLLIVVIVMTIIYTLLSTTLKIDGNSDVQDVNWNMSLEELVAGNFTEPSENATVNGNLITYGGAQILNEPKLMDTKISDYKISFEKSGDTVILEYKLTNTGKIPARVVSVDWKPYVIKSEKDIQEDVELVNEYFYSEYNLYELDLKDGKISNSKPINSGDVLCPGAVFAIQIEHGYSYDAPRVPLERVTISKLGVDFSFEAVDQSLCSN